MILDINKNMLLKQFPATIKIV